MKTATERTQKQQILIGQLEQSGVVLSNMRHIELGLKRNSYAIANGFNQFQIQTTGDVPVQNIEGCEVKNYGDRIFYNF